MPDIGLVQGRSRRRAARPKGVVADAATPAVVTERVEPEATAPAEAPPRVLARAAPQEMSILRESPGEPAIVVEARAPVAGVVSETPAPVAPVAPAAPAAAAPPAAVEPAAAPDPVAAPPPAPAFAPPRRTPEPLRAAPPPIRASDLMWLGLAFVLIIGTGLGIRDPWPADEPRFAAVARDMVFTGEWLFPRVGGDLYQDKPPFFFWLLALGYTLTGSLRFAFLIPSLLAAAGVSFLVYDLGRRLASREAGLAAAVLVICTLQFVQTMRGAQIDPTLCFLTTLSLYAFLRHLLLGPAWGWYALGGLAAGIGVITKGVGFLPLLVLLPYLLLRRTGWRGLAAVDGGGGGWRWWLAPLAMFAGICVWFVPMLVGVAQGAPEYLAYRDEILFKQTVGRYAAAWHHVKGWHYFVVEVIPALWLPWSLLLVWLVPRFRAAWRERDARVWLPLSWAVLVLLFFSASPGKRGVYVLPALPALAFASLPFVADVLARRGVRIASIVLGALFVVGGIAAIVVTLRDPIPYASAGLLGVYVALASVLFAIALWRAPVAAFPAVLAALAIWFSYGLAPRMNGERSGADFTREVLAQVGPREQLGLVAYKEQFLLYLDRDTVNFGHRRWLEGPQEAYDASAWLAAAPDRVLLVPEDTLAPCFAASSKAPVGKSSRDHWFLVRGPVDPACAAQGNTTRAILYAKRP